MTFNKVGARDSPFAETAGDSILLLGGLFAEGFGVPHDNASAFMLERLLDRNLLNFGTSGDFGPLQELSLYRHFREIEHSGLVVYVLPANDFTDNFRNFLDGISRPVSSLFRNAGRSTEPVLFFGGNPQKFIARDDILTLSKEFHQTIFVAWKAATSPSLRRLPTPEATKGAFEKFAVAMVGRYLCLHNTR